MKLYVGGLAYSTSNDRLAEVFAEFGDIQTAEVVIDRVTGQSRGFGFVEMPDEEAAKKAIEALNGQEVDGRVLTVNEAKPRDPNGPSRGGNSTFGGRPNGGFRDRR